MAERFNHSLLQLLQSYTQEEADWELHFPLALFAYKTAVHWSTGFHLLKWCLAEYQSKRVFLQTSFDPCSCQAQHRAKLAFVETHIVEKATAQKTSYDTHNTTTCSFNVGDLWLSQPTVGKLDPRWDGSWVVKSIHSPVTLQTTNGKIVYINRLFIWGGVHGQVG